MAMKVIVTLFKYKTKAPLMHRISGEFGDWTVGEFLNWSPDQFIALNCLGYAEILAHLQLSQIQSEYTIVKQNQPLVQV